MKHEQTSSQATTSFWATQLLKKPSRDQVFEAAEGELLRPSLKQNNTCPEGHDEKCVGISSGTEDDPQDENIGCRKRRKLELQLVDASSSSSSSSRIDACPPSVSTASARRFEHPLRKHARRAQSHAKRSAAPTPTNLHTKYSPRSTWTADSETQRLLDVVEKRGSQWNLLQHQQDAKGVSGLDRYLLNRRISFTSDRLADHRQKSNQPTTAIAHPPIEFLSKSIPQTSPFSSFAISHTPAQTYHVSTRGLQNHIITAILKRDYNFTLIESNDKNSSYDLKSSDSSKVIILFKWSLLPASTSPHSIADDLNIKKMIHSHTSARSVLVLLEAYSSSGLILQSTPPLENAKRALEEYCFLITGVRVQVQVVKEPVEAAQVIATFTAIEGT
ncbi:unnamed protein product [Sympodiomycopsis kandeliae]